MGQEKLYIEKELSWLSFNERVLQEAADKKQSADRAHALLGIYPITSMNFIKCGSPSLSAASSLAKNKAVPPTHVTC